MLDSTQWRSHSRDERQEVFSDGAAYATLSFFRSKSQQGQFDLSLGLTTSCQIPLAWNQVVQRSLSPFTAYRPTAEFNFSPWGANSRLKGMSTMVVTSLPGLLFDYTSGISRASRFMALLKSRCCPQGRRSVCKPQTQLLPVLDPILFFNTKPFGGELVSPRLVYILAILQAHLSGATLDSDSLSSQQLAHFPPGLLSFPLLDLTKSAANNATLNQQPTLTSQAVGSDLGLCASNKLEQSESRRSIKGSCCCRASWGSSQLHVLPIVPTSISRLLPPTSLSSICPQVNTRSCVGTPPGRMGMERGMQAVVTAAAFNSLAFIFIVIRCISRFWVIHQVGPEDYLIIFALVLSLGLTVTIALRELLFKDSCCFLQLTFSFQKRTMAWVAMPPGSATKKMKHYQKSVFTAQMQEDGLLTDGSAVVRQHHHL